MPKPEPRQMTVEELKKAPFGAIFEHYQPLIEWLQPEELDSTGRPAQGSGCKGSWKPLKQNWSATDTEQLWRYWEKLLPLFADPSVEEVFVQIVPRHPTNPTPNGYLDVISSGMLGDRIHLHLRMAEEELVNGFSIISDTGVYSKKKADGKAIFPFALDSEGVRLMGGVAPASVSAFAAIRIPSRERPSLDHMTGALRFGAGLDRSMLAEGEPLPMPSGNALEEARAKLLSLEKPEGRVMLPMESLEYLRGVAYAGWNPVFSGATSSAKTTMLNACLKLWPQHWRTVTVETGVAELRLDQMNWVPLFSNEEFRKKGEPNELSQEGIIRAAMRLSPKPIPCGEIRGSDGALYVELCSTGHEASPVTIHSGSPDEAIMRLTRMVLAGPDAGQLTEASAKIMAASTANVIFQLKRDEAVIDGKVISIRRCTSITEVQIKGSYIEGDLQIKLVPVFETVYEEGQEPRLVYVGKKESVDEATGSIVVKQDCHLWQSLKDKRRADLIPDWAK